MSLPSKEIIASLDIGTNYVRVVIAAPGTDGKVNILGIGEVPSEGVVRANITNIDKTVHSIAVAVKQATSIARVGIQHVNVAITGRYIRSSYHSGSITREGEGDEVRIADVVRLTKDMYRIVTPPGSEVIHVIPQAYQVDYERGIKDPVGIAGVKLSGEFLVITAPNNTINNIYKCVKRAGLIVSKIILAPLAASMAVLTEEEKEAGVCLIDIGGGTTDLSIFHDKILRHSTVIPLGSDTITQDIREGCTVMLPQAELLKTKFGRAMEEEEGPYEVVAIPGLRNRPDKDISVRVLSRIVEVRLQEILQWVHAEIISAGYQHKLAGGIVLTGGGAQLQGIEAITKYITKYDTRLGEPQEHLHPTQASPTLAHATLIGLALAGYQALDYREEYYKTRLRHEEAQGFLTQPSKQRQEQAGLFQRLKNLFVGTEEEE